MKSKRLKKNLQMIDDQDLIKALFVIFIKHVDTKPTQITIVDVVDVLSYNHYAIVTESIALLEKTLAPYQNKKLLLSKPALQVFHTILSSADKKCNALLKVNNYQETIALCDAIITLINLLQKNARYEVRDKLEVIDQAALQFSYEEFWYFMAISYLKNGPFDPKLASQYIEEYLTVASLNVMKTHGAKSAIHKSSYYSLKALCAAKANDIFLAQRYAAFGEAALHKALNFHYYEDSILDTYRYLFLLDLKNENYSRALHFVLLAKGCGNDILGRFFENNKKLEMTVERQNITFLMDLIEKIELTCKKELFAEKLKIANKFVETMTPYVAFNMVEKNDFSIAFSFENNFQEKAIYFFDRLKIDYTLAQNTIIIENFYQFNLKKFKDAENLILHSTLNKKEPEFADIKPVQKEPALIPPVVPFFTRAKKKTENAQAEREIAMPPATSAKKTIFFEGQGLYIKDDKEPAIYKLRGLGRKGQYVMIDEALKQVLSKSQLAKLKALCEIGKIIGNSKSRNGFIIKEEAIKAKIFHKKYRFYGTASHFAHPGKNRTLYNLKKLDTKHRRSPNF